MMDGDEMCDACGMGFDSASLTSVGEGLLCGFCFKNAKEHPTHSDTWPSPAPTEIPGLVEVGK
jgi:hypothetical protein